MYRQRGKLVQQKINGRWVTINRHSKDRDARKEVKKLKAKNK